MNSHRLDLRKATFTTFDGLKHVYFNEEVATIRLLKVLSYDYKHIKFNALIITKLFASCPNDYEN